MTGRPPPGRAGWATPPAACEGVDAPIDFKDFEPELVHAEGARQNCSLKARSFTLRRIHFRAAETLAFLPDEQPAS